MDVLANADRYHWAYYEAETFRGPSLYFHQRALLTRKSASLPTHLEYVYATLVSWGMHRMGPGGSKMRPFDTFRRSVEPLKEKIVEAQQFSPQNMPNIVPPIDRQYTLRYLRGNTNITNNLGGEWQIMKEIMSEFFIPVARDLSFDNKAHQWMTNQEKYPWDTTPLKVIDNLVIGTGKVSPPAPANRRTRVANHGGPDR